MMDLTLFDGHTPGPWEARGDAGDKIAPALPYAAPLAMSLTESGIYPEKAWRANARLIAAAPTILADLIRKRDALEQIAQANPDLDRFREFGAERQLQDARLFIAALIQTAKEALEA